MLSLFIINKHGSLIYYKNLVGDHTLSSNDNIRLASTLHGLSTISLKLCMPKSDNNTVPNPKGINYIDSDTFKLQCLETITGLCIFMISDMEGPSRGHMNIILNDIYELYSDYVQKCPFHQIDMPIRSQLFEDQISLYFKEWMD